MCVCVGGGGGGLADSVFSKTVLFIHIKASQVMISHCTYKIPEDCLLLYTYKGYDFCFLAI